MTRRITQNESVVGLQILYTGATASYYYNVATTVASHCLSKFQANSSEGICRIKPRVDGSTPDVSSLMCWSAEDVEEVMDFHLADRFTFLEYVPVKQIERCKSAPDVLLAQSHISDSLSQACRLGSVSHGTEEAASRSCVSGGFAFERLTTSSTAASADTQPSWVEATSAVDEPKKAAVNEETTPSSCWSDGSALHSQGLCKPCVWYWRPGSCTRGRACRHCHLCPKGALRTKKYENQYLAKALREGSEASAA